MKTTPLLLFSLVALILSASHPRLAAQTTPTLDTLYSFSSAGAEGHYPNAALVQGSDGNFYGTTSRGGGGDGAVFKITPQGTLTVLHNFPASGTGGRALFSALVEGSDGNFYGTTPFGGSGGGTVFEITPTGVLTTLHNFSSGDGLGATPYDLILGSDGNFYGTTERGGPNGHGIVYRLTPTGDFALLTTLFPSSGNGTGLIDPTILQGSDGNFYGTDAYVGGTVNGQGAVFKVTPDGTFTTLHAFTGGASDGSTPFGALIEGGDGNFYGTTVIGGSNGLGTIFRLTPAGDITILHTFDSDAKSGVYPQTGLLLASDGNFYGTTSDGNGNNDGGTIFQLTPAGDYTVLHHFTAPAGLPSPPLSVLIEGDDGNLYGTSYNNGSNGFGSVFRLDVDLRRVEFAAPTYPAAEAAGAVALQIVREGGATGAATVQYATADGTALAGHDYTAKSGTLSWADGDSSPRNITVDLLNPGEEYPNARRRFTVNLSAPSSGTNLGANAVATVVLRGTTQPPVITSPATADADATVPFSYQIKGTHSPRRFAVLGLPKGLTVDDKTGLISGTPPAAGTHLLTLKAFNVGGEGTKTLTLTVTLRAPVITSPDTAAGTQGVPFRYQIVATGHPGHYAVDGLVHGLTVESKTGLISGYPKGVGTHPMTLHAFNSRGEGTQTLQLTIDKEAPVITSPLTASGKVGSAFSYQITADGDPAQYRVLGLREGLKVDADTGLITGTPTAAGRFKLTLEAVNSAGTGTATLTVTVTD